MKILLVEDDQNKRERLSAFLSEIAPEAQVALAISYRSAVQKVLTEPWDVLLLDMTLPTYDVSEREDGFQTEALAGLNVLREMKRKKVDIATIVVTQFETLGEGQERLSLTELRRRLEAEFPGTYRGTIYYSPGESTWMPELRALLASL